MNDLISRRAAIDELWKSLYEYEDKTEQQFQESEDLDVGEWIGHRIFVQNMNDLDRQTILNLPSYNLAIEALQEPERKKGKWIGRPVAGYATVRCSVCKDAFLENRGKWNYCPNCGAKMDGEEEHDG